MRAVSRHAACSCGQLLARTEAERVRVSVCHCLTCQRRTDNDFTAQARFPRSAVVITGSSVEFVCFGDERTATIFRVHHTTQPQGWILHGHYEEGKTRTLLGDVRHNPQRLPDDSRTFTNFCRLNRRSTTTHLRAMGIYIKGVSCFLDLPRLCSHAVQRRCYAQGHVSPRRCRPVRLHVDGKHSAFHDGCGVCRTAGLAQHSASPLIARSVRRCLRRFRLRQSVHAQPCHGRIVPHQCDADERTCAYRAERLGAHKPMRSGYVSSGRSWHEAAFLRIGDPCHGVQRRFKHRLRPACPQSRHLEPRRRTWPALDRAHDAIRLTRSRHGSVQVAA